MEWNGLSMVFLAVLNMSITASVVIGFVFVGRLALRRAPRGFSYALWAVVLFRLLCPVSFALPFAAVGVTGVLPAGGAQSGVMQYFSLTQKEPNASALPEDEAALAAKDEVSALAQGTQEGEVPPSWADDFAAQDGGAQATAKAEEDVAALGEDGFALTNPASSGDNIASLENDAASKGQGWSALVRAVLALCAQMSGTVAVTPTLRWASTIWALGALSLMGWNACALYRLRRSLRGAAPYQEAMPSEAVKMWRGATAKIAIYRTDAVPTAFVWGICKPCIFLPSHLSQQEQGYILQHEKIHIARHDPLWQALGFCALCLHWFNPLVWLAYRANQKDMELSCDERVLRQMGNEIKREYAQSLLNLSAGRHGAMQAVLAFGESHAKSRIQNVLSYCKPAFWVSVLAGVAFLVAGVLLLANPMPKQRDAQMSGSENVATSQAINTTNSEQRAEDALGDTNAVQPDPTSAPQEDLQASLGVEYGSVNLAPVEREALFADLESVPQSVTLNGAQVQLVPQEMVLVYASADEAVLLIPSVKPAEGDASQNWYEMNATQQDGKWVMDNAVAEDSEASDKPAVYQHDGTGDVKTQLWQDIIPHNQYAKAQYVGDSDGDGVDEIFAFVVSLTDEKVDKMTVADLWCYHDRTYEKIKEVTVGGLSTDPVPMSDDAPRWMSVGERNLLAVMQTSMTWVSTDVYTVQDGAVVAFESIGQTITQGDESIGEDEGDFTVMVDAYDSNYILNETDGGLLYTGRTTKPYYLYWDEANCVFREYGAIPIHQADLSALGMDTQALEVLLQEEAGTQTEPLRIDDMYQFANGKYKVNYSYGTAESAMCYYLALAREGDTLVNETPRENSGYYLPAVYPAVAVYPTLAQTDLADYFTNAIAAVYAGEGSGMVSKDAQLTKTDLDRDGAPELWMMVEVYKNSVAYVFELGSDGTAAVVGDVDCLPYAMQISEQTMCYVPEEGGSNVLYFKQEEGLAVMAGSYITETFFTMQNNQLVRNGLFCTVGFKDAAETYRTDRAPEEEALTKAEYEAKRGEYLQGASSGTAQSVKTVQTYAEGDTLAHAVAALLG